MLLCIYSQLHWHMDICHHIYVQVLGSSDLLMCTGIWDPSLGSHDSGSQHLGPVIWVPSVQVPLRHLTGPGSSTIWVPGPGSQGPIKSFCSSNCHSLQTAFTRHSISESSMYSAKVAAQYCSSFPWDLLWRSFWPHFKLRRTLQIDTKAFQAENRSLVLCLLVC